MGVRPWKKYCFPLSLCCSWNKVFDLLEIVLEMFLWIMYISLNYVLVLYRGTSLLNISKLYVIHEGIFHVIFNALCNIERQKNPLSNTWIHWLLITNWLIYGPSMKKFNNLLSIGEPTDSINVCTRSSMAQKATHWLRTGFRFLIKAFIVSI